MGHVSLSRGAPSVLYLPTEWIVNHRTVEHRLSENRWPKANIKLRYFTEDERKKDEWMIENLREGAKAGVAWITAVVEAQIKELGELKARLEADDAIDLDQAALRARVDTGDEGELLHRYGMDAERGLIKVVATLRGGVTAWNEDLQTQTIQNIPSNPAPADAPRPATQAAPAVSRNGPTGAARSHKPDLTRVAEDEGVSFVDFAITPRTDRPNRE